MSASACASVVLATCLLGQACSSSTMPPANSEGGAGVGGLGGMGGPGGSGGGGGTGAESGCPAAAPANGGTCAAEGRICSWGAAPRGECRDRATCASGRWVVHAGSCAAPSPPAECPGAAPAPTSACARPQQLCEYAGGTECLCLAGGLGWTCDAPRTTGGECPAATPNAGTTCAGAPACTYVCGLLSAHAVLAHCVGGTWTWALMPCASTN